MYGKIKVRYILIQRKLLKIKVDRTKNKKIRTEIQEIRLGDIKRREVVKKSITIKRGE